MLFRSVSQSRYQVKSHEEVIFMATDAISLILEIPKNSIEVAVEYRGQLSETLNK